CRSVSLYRFRLRTVSAHAHPPIHAEDPARAASAYARTRMDCIKKRQKWTGCAHGTVSGARSQLVFAWYSLTLFFSELPRDNSGYRPQQHGTALDHCIHSV